MPSLRDTSIRTYRAKRDFRATPEPPARARAAKAKQRLFVVQKHAARRLHWDFRLEYAGVLWSWAVPKGPSLDPADKRLAVHVEDHPVDYAGFEGTIPEGQYGAGTVEIWDRGTWSPVGDPEEGMRRGELKFTLQGARLNGGFVLVRLKPRERERNENWLLIKEHDEYERDGATAEVIEAEGALPKKARAKTPAKAASARAETKAEKAAEPPAPGAVHGKLPETQAPQLAQLADAPPPDEGWVSELKFDGYRLLAFKNGDKVRLITRNGLDWTSRFPRLAAAIAKLPARTALLDGELVALDPGGISSFPLLQQALSEGRDRDLVFYAFDLLHLDGWDLRPCALVDRKAVLEGLTAWGGALRYSEHLDASIPEMRKRACAMGLEGIICKRAGAPYHAGRGASWLKLKCQGREEFVVLGWTPPAGSRSGLGSLHLGFYDAQGALHYVGGVGTGFSEQELTRLSARLDTLKTGRPPGLLLAGDPPDRSIHWVKPELVVEVQYVGWSGAGRLRHAVYLGLREDKTARDVVREVPNPEAARSTLGARAGRPAVVTARAPKPKSAEREGVHLTNADRELWPGITKQDLADYWHAVARWALPGIAHRPLAFVRCPEGIGGEHFFQKHARKGMPAQITEGEAGGHPYLAIEDEAGLIACAQMAAIELHSWGSGLDDPLHPDRIVFDLDPGEGVPFAEVVRAAKELRARLKALGLETFCRTTGGKGLHVVAPLRPEADWDRVKGFCRDFARGLEQEDPDRFIATVSKQKRRGRILVDWLRNGLGATAVASYVPRARPGATVATPLAWREVTEKLDPAAFTLHTVPQRLQRQKRDPWDGFESLEQTLPTGRT